MGAICEFFCLDKLDGYDVQNKLLDMLEKERYVHGEINLYEYEWVIGLDVYHCLKTCFFDNGPDGEDLCHVYIPRTFGSTICGIHFEVLSPTIFRSNRVALRKKPKITTKENRYMDSLSSLAYGYAIHDAIATQREYNKMYRHKPQDPIKKVIFNDPATIVFWNDGSKTVVKAEGEKFDPEKGLAMAIAKKSLGNQGNYYDIFRKWLPKENLKGE